VSERLTSIHLPGHSGSSGYADWGRKSVAEMVAIIRHRAEAAKQEAEAILAAQDSDFHVCTYRGVYVQRHREVLQQGKISK
jgi:hypothetical protein